MARITQVVTVCDGCGSTEPDVAEHHVALEKRAPVVVDACASCWDTAAGPFLALVEKGQSAKVAARRPRASRSTEVPAPAAKKTAAKKAAAKPAKKTAAKKSARKG